jgi:phosphoserine phosphatase RsbU/P
MGDFFREFEILWPSLIAFEFVIYYLFIYWAILKPINELRLEIAIFLTWWKRWQKMAINSPNPAMQYVLSFFNKSLEILKNFKEELRSGKELKSEVQLASEIQKNTLTKNLPVIPSIDIVANTKSATEVGWDSYDVIKQWENYYIYLWDVTWHWVASGFVMMMVNALVSGFSKKLINSAEIVSHTNEILKPRVPSNMLMTLLMVRWNEMEKKMYMTWAWHEYLLVYKASQKKAFKIKSWWVALWMTKDISKILKESQIWVEEWDIIILYTDGITEARNTNSEDWMMFWVDKLVETIENSPYKTAQWVFNNITIDLSKWMWYNHKQFDDITLLVAHYKWSHKNEHDADKIIPKENITEWYWK